MTCWLTLATHRLPPQRQPQEYAIQIIPEPSATWISKIGMLIERQEAMLHARCTWNEMNIQETVVMPVKMGMSSAQCNWIQNPWMTSLTQRAPCWIPT